MNRELVFVIFGVVLLFAVTALAICARGAEAHQPETLVDHRDRATPWEHVNKRPGDSYQTIGDRLTIDAHRSDVADRLVIR